MRGVITNWWQKIIKLSSYAQTRCISIDSHVQHLWDGNNFSEAIHLLSRKRGIPEALEFLNRLDQPSPAIYSNLIQHCLQQRDVDSLKQVHLHAENNNVGGEKIYNCLLKAYCKYGCFIDAHKVFDKMSERDHYCWYAMISGYVEHDQPGNALNLFRVLMEKKYDHGSSKFIICALSACNATRRLHSGKEIHGHIVRNGWDFYEEVCRSLLVMYVKCETVDESRCIFDKSMTRDVLLWTEMIDRYFEDGRWGEGFNLFVEMLSSGITPNEFTFSGVLNACTSLTAEYLGKRGWKFCCSKNAV